MRIRTPNFTSYNVDMQKLRFVALLALIFLACRTFQPGILEEELLSTREAVPTVWVTPAAWDTPEAWGKPPVQETAPVWGTPPQTAETLPDTQPGSSPQAVGQQEVDFVVRTHPDGALYVGDRVSFEVIPPEGFELPGKTVSVRVVRPIEQELGVAEFGRYGIGRRAQATLTWAWDTRALQPGQYEVEFAILPQGPAWSQSVELLPADAL